MAKAKVNIGTPESPNWVTLDANDGDTVDGLHFRVSGGKLQYSADGVTWAYAGTNTDDATAVAANILSGKSAYAKGQKLTGTMPDRGAVMITPGTSNQAILDGYHNGSGYVAGDPDLVARNIRNGVNIFGVVGTLVEGKRWATGGASPDSKGVVTVTGLTFTAKIIILRQSYYHTDSTTWHYYQKVYVDSPVQGNANVNAVLQTLDAIYYTSSGTGSGSLIASTPFTVTATGFSTGSFTPGKTSVDWFAFE